MNHPPTPYTLGDQEELALIAAELEAVARHIRLRGVLGHNKQPMAVVEERLAKAMKELVVHLPRFKEHPESIAVARRFAMTMPRDELGRIISEKDLEIKQLRKQLGVESDAEVAYGMQER